MSGGLKVGDLYVLLSAKTSAFGKSMESAAKMTEKVAKKIKASAQEIGRVGAIMAAGIGAALAIAAQHNAAVANEVQRSKDVFATFANEIATMMLPALREMNQILRDALGWWQALSPETKAQIAHWVEIATVVGLAAIVFGKVAGLVAALAPLFGALGAVLSIGLTPLLLIVGAVVALGVAVALLHKAWRENWGGIQEKTRSVVEALSGYWQSFKEWMSTNFFDWFIDKWAEIEKTIAHAGNFLKHPFDSGQRDVANRGSDEDINKWAAKLKVDVGSALELAADKVQAGADTVIDEWRIIASEVKHAFQAIIGLEGVQNATVMSSAAQTHVSTAQRLGEVGEQGRMAEFYKDADVIREGFGSSKKLGDEDEQGFTSAGVAEAYKEEIATRQRFNDSLKGLVKGLASAAMSVTAKLGDLGKVINSAVSGFQSGGWIGAIVAVVMELFSMWEGFQEILDYANSQVMGAVKDLASGFEGLKEGLMTFMDASGVMTDVIMQILNPILKIVGGILKAISPLIEAIAVALSGLVPIFELLETVLGPIFEVVGYVLRFVALTILGTMNGLLMLWQGILEIVNAIVKATRGGVEDAGIRKMLNENWQRILGVQEQMKNMFETGSVTRGERAIDRLADAADRATESLTNLPTGVKIAYERFAAASALTGAGAGSPSFGSISYETVERENARQSFRNSGNTTAFRRRGG